MTVSLGEQYDKGKIFPYLFGLTSIKTTFPPHADESRTAGHFLPLVTSWIGILFHEFFK